MTKQLTKEKILAAGDTIEAFLETLSDEDSKKQRKALSKYCQFLSDSMLELVGLVEKETPIA